VTILSLWLSASLWAQNLDSARLLHPPPDTWPLYHGDYSGKRHSSLAQITPDNVANLALSWVFQTNQSSMIKSTPLVVDGVIYFKKYPDRYRLIHVKDFLPNGAPTTEVMGPRRPKGTELGRGHIDYKPIFAAAGAAGIEYYFSEQEPPIEGMTAIDAARVNYGYMLNL